VFSKLHDEILKFKEQGEILLGGDLNARTSELKDFIPNDDNNKFYRRVYYEMFNIIKNTMRSNHV
jgi:hypothetical protein